MGANFTFEVDPSRDLIRIRMSGFFTPADIEAFLKARRDAHARLLCAPNRHVTLNDLREMKIQSQEAVDAFREILADPAYRSRRLAFIVSSTLARAQLGRALASRQARTFQDPTEAEAWLFATGATARAA
jgi:hypothetical protein